MNETEPGALIERQDKYMIALAVKRLADAGELSQQQANTILKRTEYRLEQKPLYEIQERGAE